MMRDTNRFCQCARRINRGSS